MYSDVYLRILCSVNLPERTGLRAEGIQTNNQRGGGSGSISSWGVWTVISSDSLVSRREPLYERSVQGCIRTLSTRHIVLLLITGSYWRLRILFAMFEPEEMKFAAPLTLLFCRPDHWKRDSFWNVIKWYRIKFGQSKE